MNDSKSNETNGFDEWFNELVGFSFRDEWFYDDFDYATKTGDYKIIVKWLRTAYEMGYNDRVNEEQNGVN